MAVSKRLRYEILRRDNHQCRYCGAAAPDVKLTVDHVVPQALGGLDDPTNLVTACSDCNSGKSASSPDAPIVADVEARAIAWAAAIEIAAAERYAKYCHQEEVREDFAAMWGNWTWTDARGEQHSIELPSIFGPSVDQFVAAGLTRIDLRELIEVAMTARTADAWKYFCGCCWRRIRESNDRAAQIIEEAAHGA